MTERPGFLGYPPVRRPRRHAQPRAGRADGDLLVAWSPSASPRRRAARHGAAPPRRLRPARSRHARDARHARRLLRASERRRRGGGGARAASRSWRRLSPMQRDGTASRPKSSRFRGKAEPCARRRRGSRRAGARRSSRHRSRARGAMPRSSMLSVKCGGSDYTSGLASNPTLGRVADRLVDARRRGGARRDRRDHGGRAPAGVARDAPGDRDQADAGHHPRRDRGARARASTFAAPSRRQATSAAA